MKELPALRCSLVFIHDVYVVGTPLYPRHTHTHRQEKIFFSLLVLAIVSAIFSSSLPLLYSAELTARSCGRSVVGK